MAFEHRYRVEVEWTGNRGSGTSAYRAYDRDHVIRIDGKPELAGSADPSFFGDRARYNPEDMLLSALSACHMMSYLHMATVAGVVVVAYVDHAEATMATAGEGGHFVEAVLQPVVTISAESDPAKALAAHNAAHHACFIANSVNFPVQVVPRIEKPGFEIRD
ncbi:MAG: OsmC family peroxiredoxin [Rhodanobacter sp.]|nr:MAG: OsmC family peroxiredoxin [Rhodanobacter sp.]TAM14569.1 MAG: OsmC family peroxiredoxin [Rhodanobacter sp.]TAM37361.1 MAG: OsmC family peroxiredoxin [Rhodanobacter sp.]